MAASRLISFSSPVRPNLSKEESTDPEAGSPDEELHFDKNEEVQAGEGDPAPSGAPPEDNLPHPTESDKLKTGRRHPRWKFGNGAKLDEHHHPPLLPLVSSLTAACFVVTVATTASHIVLDAVVAAAIILALTCLIIGWGVLSLTRRNSTLICIYGFLLVFESIALVVAGGLEAAELKAQMDLTNELSSGVPPRHDSTGSQTLADAQRRTEILAAFTGLFFVCALLFIATAVLDFHLYGDIRVKKRLRLDGESKEKEQQTEKTEHMTRKEGAVRIPEHRAPSPDLLDEEELLDVGVTAGDATPHALAEDKEAQLV